MMYRCETINDLKQIESVYRKWMKKDFPPSELKPFASIKKDFVNQEYVCFGIFREDTLCGYAFFATKNIENGRRQYLLDYFAVAEKERNQGIGSQFLQMLANAVTDCDLLICEAENPQDAEDEAEKLLRQRRVGFYLRNGFSDTGITTRLFGVEYVILALKNTPQHSQEEIKTFYHAVYSRIIPKLLLQKNLIIH